MTLAAMLAIIAQGAADARAETVRVIVPDTSLQYMTFWIAQGAGLFRNEGIDIETFIPVAPQATPQAVTDGKAEVAVLPPPVYIELIDRKIPIVLIANLMRNDPINLVVRKSVLEARHVALKAPLGERLRALRGIKVGIANNPPPRLRALYASVGLDADRDVEQVILGGKQQNAAFRRGEVDALYAHTPHLEEAIVDDGAVMVVNQSAGEVPALANRQLHALVCTRAFVAAHPRTVAGLARAVARAARLVHADRAAAARALLHALPSLDAKHVDALLAIYEPAIPETPRVSADGFRAALALFPAGRITPDLTGVDLNAFVAPRFSEDAAK
jgi:ABC-type nitrate/sulfonate/bicarbonate transport system substrate-binding protein